MKIARLVATTFEVHCPYCHDRLRSSDGEFAWSDNQVREAAFAYAPLVCANCNGESKMSLVRRPEIK